MKNNTKKIATGMLAIMIICILFTGASFASANIQDGQYTINVKAVNATNGEVSMADNSITKPVKLEVQNGNIYVILEMADSMYDLAVENSSGGFDLAEELSENTAAKTFTYKFPVRSIEEPVLMETVVAAMGRKVNLKLDFDSASLVKVAPKTTATTTTTNSSTNVVNPQTRDNSFRNLSNVVLLAMGATVVTYGVHKAKEKRLLKTNK